MRARGLLVSVATVALLASACGSAGQPSASAPATRSLGGMAGMAHMSPDEMAAMSGPSGPARMICSDEIGSAVRRTFALPRRPSTTRSWSASDLTFACTYRLPGGALRITVQDAPDATTGRPYFRRLRSGLAGATPIHGVQALGLPAFETPSGEVAFLKDGKTLRVDARHVPRDVLPTGFSREETAYGVAAAVVGCWSE